jgi:ATP-dependent Lhr-like helicase
MDALDEEDINRERVRVLLQRYGVVFRGLLAREMPLLQWPKMFRTLRLMELSSEVVGGYFFEEIPGIQFVAPAAISRLQERGGNDSVYWINAKDPASLCGLGLTALNLPPRVVTTHLVYRGSTLVLVSKRSGKHLTFNVPDTDPRMHEYLGFIRTMLTRDAAPVGVLTIEKINGKSAANSPYRRVFEIEFDTWTTHRTLSVARRYSPK